VLRFQGLKFKVPKENECFWPYYGICFVGEYDLILENIKSSDIVLDAGANIGIFTLLASRKAKRVIAVEPDPENFSYLVKNVKINCVKNVVLVNKALSNYMGRGYISGRGPLKALSQAGHPVEVTTIDALLNELCFRKIDVTKMDVEGAESKALVGNFLTGVRELMVETHSGRATEVIRQMLKSKGFMVKEWNFSRLAILKRVFWNIEAFVDAELKTRFSTTLLVLKYLLRFSSHLVPAADVTSGIRLLYASKSESNKCPYL
jgi:FkbM family methyltransferase